MQRSNITTGLSVEVATYFLQIATEKQEKEQQDNMDILVERLSTVYEELDMCEYPSGLDYKDIPVVRENYLQELCQLNGLKLNVISDAFSCPRNPKYFVALKENTRFGINI